MPLPRTRYSGTRRRNRRLARPGPQGTAADWFAYHTQHPASPTDSEGTEASLVTDALPDTTALNDNGDGMDTWSAEHAIPALSLPNNNVDVDNHDESASDGSEGGAVLGSTEPAMAEYMAEHVRVLEEQMADVQQLRQYVRRLMEFDPNNSSQSSNNDVSPSGEQVRRDTSASAGDVDPATGLGTGSVATRYPSARWTDGASIARIARLNARVAAAQREHQEAHWSLDGDPDRGNDLVPAASPIDLQDQVRRYLQPGAAGQGDAHEQDDSDTDDAWNWVASPSPPTTRESPILADEAEHDPAERAQSVQSDRTVPTEPNTPRISLSRADNMDPIDTPDSPARGRSELRVFNSPASTRPGGVPDRHLRPVAPTSGNWVRPRPTPAAYDGREEPDSLPPTINNADTSPNLDNAVSTRAAPAAPDSTPAQVLLVADRPGTNDPVSTDPAGSTNAGWSLHDSRSTTVHGCTPWSPQDVSRICFGSPGGALPFVAVYDPAHPAQASDRQAAPVVVHAPATDCVDWQRPQSTHVLSRSRLSNASNALSDLGKIIHMRLRADHNGLGFTGEDGVERNRRARAVLDSLSRGPWSGNIQPVVPCQTTSAGLHDRAGSTSARSGPSPGSQGAVDIARQRPGLDWSQSGASERDETHRLILSTLSSNDLPDRFGVAVLGSRQRPVEAMIFRRQPSASMSGAAWNTAMSERMRRTGARVFGSDSDMGSSFVQVPVPSRKPPTPGASFELR